MRMVGGTEAVPRLAGKVSQGLGEVVQPERGGGVVGAEDAC
jgi:hypothetical protein